MTVKAWTDDEIREFIKYVESKGGHVSLPVLKLRDGGIQAQIHTPTGVQIGWGQQVLTDFNNQRK